MQSLWKDNEGKQFKTDLEQRVYTSRLLGSDPSLVLHGGGNTSVKVTEKNLLGEELELLYVKGSGWDLATIEAAGFAPVQMNHLLKLARLEQLSDTDMARELRVATINPSAPAPSVEAILHALLPYKFVDHTHTDALVTIMNTPSGRERITEIYGDSVVVIPYVMPGFSLAKLCYQEFPRQVNAKTVGMVLMNHGLFTFGETARESYERMIALVDKAEKYLKRKGAWRLELPKTVGSSKVHPATIHLDKVHFDKTHVETLATLRRDISKLAGQPMLVARHNDKKALAFAQRQDITTIATRGPATPDHVIRTKRIPLVGRDLATYSKNYTKYFEKLAKKSKQSLTMLDTAPRIILDPELGLLTVGKTATETRIAEDIYRHTMEIIARAEGLESWQALADKDIFEVEYWELEQAKLRKAGSVPEFQGEVMLVTGAASGIGKACAETFLKRGAAVVGLDLNSGVTTLFTRPDYLGIVCDVTNEKAVKGALEQTVDRFGGLDMLVLNAGIFPPSKMISNLSLEEWKKVLNVNLDANVTLLRETYPLLKLAPNGGRVVVNASKNVPAPGPGAAAYSAAKAALTQLARVAALEWGADNIRVNVLHPNAVFDTGIWTQEILEKRAKSYGLTTKQYKTNNVLKTEVTSHDVARLAAELCSQTFAKTTGAQIPVDGGNDRVI
jgi:rhamnose utilization protein RhaD (predicted bifunctional aldolase and dehydrogenase)/NAD(P)-dependent dehydrogenase (short-subunit alcohol dehydrogenase family)